MAEKADTTIQQPNNTDILYWFSGIQVWHLEDEFFLIRDFTPSHLTCAVLRTPLIMNILCTAGAIQGQIDGKAFTLRANDSLIILPMQTTELQYISPDMCCTLVAISRDNAEAQNVGEEYTLYENIMKNPLVTFTEEQMRANIAMTEMYAYTIQQRNHPRQREILVLLQKVNHMLHATTLHNKQMPSDTAMERTGSLAVRFNRLVEAHYMREHQVTYYAGRLSVTPKYLSSAIMQASGHTAGWWIDYYLMRDAERYLKETRLPVQNIADLLGFADQSAFGKYFRRQRGISPVQFRAEAKRDSGSKEANDNQ